MRVFKKFLFFILECIIVTILVFNLATLFPIPYLGSLANHYTVPYVRVWLPLLFLLFLVSLWISLNYKKSKWHSLNAITAFISLLIGFYIVIDVQTTINHLGAEANFLKSYQLEDISGVEVATETYTRSPHGDVKLNIYHTDDRLKNKPVLVYIHGGGWVAGHRSSHSYYWKSFAKDNYVVVSLDYDLSSRHRHLSSLTEKQLTQAFAWIENNIQDYGGSTDHLFVTGVSAGGNLALELAYKINNGTYEQVDGTKLPKVKAVSVSYPVASPKSFYDNNDLAKGDIAKRMVMAYLGGRPDQLPKAYADLTPKNAISDKTPPTLFLAGQRDTLVPQEATYDLAADLKKRNIPNKLVIFPYTNHAFDRIDGNLGSQAYLNLSKDWFKEYMSN
ncbi:alpha/beta hydrolase [Streptococcus didelphis]|uniref:alpha/beta hydrolase n=1 Tax=Streptococcus didelphis TaxID=102886 RepID=UPI00037794DD|nr:alpha/beta hydrolase [Streptococcus didelphis]